MDEIANPAPERRQAVPPPRVWVVGPFTNPARMAEGDRFLYVADRLRASGADVTFFTSAFDHYAKGPKPSPTWPGIRFVRVWEPGYRSNVSLRRVVSHLIFDLLLAVAAVGELIRHGRPRSIYCPIPHNLGALLLAAFGRLMGSRIVIDVHDTWPESLLAVHHLRPYERPLFAVWRWTADAALRLADAVVAESMRYAARADRVRTPRRLSPARCVYLGGDPAYYSDARTALQLPDEIERATTRFAYVGNLGRNYDLELVVRTFRALQDDYSTACVVFLGAGELERELRELAASLELHAWFSGLLPHRDLIALLGRMHYGLNTFAPGGNVAYSYKLNDYLLAGVPVINALAGEAWEMIEGHDLGYNYHAGDATGLARALRRALDDPARAQRQRLAVRAFATARLDRSRTYEPIVAELLG
jgi:glycosyltransferase involved in cell wall biosynthesis